MGGIQDAEHTYVYFCQISNSGESKRQPLTNYEGILHPSFCLARRSINIPGKIFLPDTWRDQINGFVRELVHLEEGIDSDVTPLLRVHHM